MSVNNLKSVYPSSWWENDGDDDDDEGETGKSRGHKVEQTDGSDPIISPVGSTRSRKYENRRYYHKKWWFWLLVTCIVLVIVGLIVGIVALVARGKDKSPNDGDRAINGDMDAPASSSSDLTQSPTRAPTLSPSSRQSPPPTIAPTQSPSISLTAAPTQTPFSAPSGSPSELLGSPEHDGNIFLLNRVELGDMLLSMYTERGMDSAPLNDTDSLQGQALVFVAGSLTYDTWSEAQRVERYALVVFFLATFRQPHMLLPEALGWTSRLNWLSDESVCAWEGIVCNDDDSVGTILLPNHQLSGTLPPELSLLVNLATLDLTSNSIFMAGSAHHFLWTIMPALQELSMDDNFFTTREGLPSEFHGLSSIQKISLSYNLLQGSLDGGLFEELSTLRHLRMESNYLEGTLPEQLLSLESLMYLYVRRNFFEIDLDQLFQRGNLPSIVALWLDSNDIGGAIPTTIGLHTDLASLSIADSDLTGPLPVQLGNLGNMRRCWLHQNGLGGPVPPALSEWQQLQVLEVYDNELTGIMPPLVCDAVGTTEYESRALSADCAEVECTDCCTKCY